MFTLAGLLFSLVWWAVLVFVVCFAAWYGFTAAAVLFRHFIARRCMRCGHLVAMNPQNRAVLKAYSVVFCQACMPVGDQLAQVSKDHLVNRELGGL